MVAHDREREGSCIAIIPARGGSRRIPNKNIRPFAGAPLIAHSIEAALQSGLFERVIVSTDSETIADVAERHGAEVPFLREPALSDDITPVSAATVDALERLDPQGLRYEYVAQLMANCPLRTAHDIVESFQCFVSSKAEAQLSVASYGWQNPWWAMHLDASGRVLPAFPEKLQERSQDLKEVFCPSGAIWWALTGVLRRHRTFHVEGRTGWILPWSHALDIDTEEDFELAEALSRHVWQS